jgi:hypothetical protein
MMAAMGQSGSTAPVPLLSGANETAGGCDDVLGIDNPGYRGAQRRAVPRFPQNYTEIVTGVNYNALTIEAANSGGAPVEVTCAA